ncbi:hypothetical protein P171DRAFT_434975 [Karstenula rhodostoma CBS 690.94]|uniref:Rhodopsin domain-containing protein n=1 Tax=Karstenula rhodostoma CBS 690.94 TaxID=1392251 RepID=A0A9P4PCG6_9PLEO|nr:hypothetical protein P171DRAFT_434975 [Karstenula rhodostoma CBS 690.94]
MMAGEHHSDRSGTGKVVNITSTILMTFFGMWRLIVRFRINPRLGWSDYWIVLALLSAEIGHGWALASLYSGEGRLDVDINIEIKARVRFLTFIGGAFNTYAVGFAKLSICAYLLGLNFSHIYRRFVYSSIMIILICNFTLPMMSHWVSCRPVQASWDVRIKSPDCWPVTFKTTVAYIQGGSNVVTDLLYAAAPIIYLRRIHLSRYTKWGVRLVFLMALFGTAVSIAKIYQFGYLLLKVKTDTVYHTVTTTALSVSENSLCIIVACLPPLRRTFDDLLKKVLPRRVLQSIGALNSRPGYDLPTIYTTKINSDGEHSHNIPSDKDYVEGIHGRIICRSPKSVACEERVAAVFGKSRGKYCAIRGRG